MNPSGEQDKTKSRRDDEKVFLSYFWFSFCVTQAALQVGSTIVPSQHTPLTKIKHLCKVWWFNAIWGRTERFLWWAEHVFIHCWFFFKLNQIAFVLLCRNLLQIATAWFLFHQYMSLQPVLHEIGVRDTQVSLGGFRVEKDELSLEVKLEKRWNTLGPTKVVLKKCLDSNGKTWWENKPACSALSPPICHSQGKNIPLWETDSSSGSKNTFSWQFERER